MTERFVLLQIDPPPPVITNALGMFGAAIDSMHPVQPGDTITVTATNVLDPLGNLPDISTLAINVGGVDQPASSLNQVGNTVLIQVAVPQTVTPGAGQITLREQTRVSAPYTIYVQ